MTTCISVKLVEEGLHNWSTCNIEEVNYLASLHRHLFHITCKKVVHHDDRDIEFIQFKHDIQEHLFMAYFDEQRRTLNFGSMSCEMIAKELIEVFNLKACLVYEDNENGAEVYND